MKEIVRYKNEFNTVPLRNFNAVELDFLMTLCAKVREKNTEKLLLHFNEIRKLTHYSQNSNVDFVKDLDSTNAKLIQCNYREEEEDGIIERFTLFHNFRIDTHQKTLEIQVNKKFEMLLNKKDEYWFFTRFELEEFINLKSSYAKECYRRLKAFRNTGFWEVSIEEFRYLLDVPESYLMHNIDKRVLKPIKKELSDIFFNFNIKKIKKGRKIAKLRFTFTPEKNLKNNVILEISSTEEKKGLGLFKNVFLAESDIRLLDKTMTKKEIDDYIHRLSTHIESKGVKYKNHAATILKWHKQDQEKKKSKKTNFQNFETGIRTNLNDYIKKKDEGRKQLPKGTKFQNFPQTEQDELANMLKKMSNLHNEEQ